MPAFSSVMTALAMSCDKSSKLLAKDRERGSHERGFPFSCLRIKHLICFKSVDSTSQLGSPMKPLLLLAEGNKRK